MQTRGALKARIRPTLALDGTGGSYFIANSDRKKVAVFKPADEEQFAPNNPRGFAGTLGQVGFRKGILSGTSCRREVAAYLLDHEGRAGVPPTLLADLTFDGMFHYADRSAKHGPKLGSLQAFVDSEGTAGDRAPACFDTLNVQAIALLDCRLLNGDRNDGNLLVQKLGPREFRLCPIDHGYALPSVLELSSIDWVWFDWPQLDEPVHDDLRSYLLDIDIEADAAILRDRLGIDEAAIELFQLVHAWIVEAVNADLTLKQIASALCRYVLTFSRPLARGVSSFHFLVGFFPQARTRRRRRITSLRF